MVRTTLTVSRGAATFFVLALAYACSGGGDGSRGGPAAPLPATGTLVVHVERDGAGPEVGVLVRITGLGRSARTGPDGDASFADLAAGDYTLRVEPEAGDPVERSISFGPPFPRRVDVVLSTTAGSALTIEGRVGARLWGDRVDLRAVVTEGDAANVEWRSLDDLYLERPVVLGRGPELVTRALKPGLTTVEARLVENGEVVARATVDVDVRYRERWNVDALDLVEFPSATVADVLVDGGVAYVARRTVEGFSAVRLEGVVTEGGGYAEAELTSGDVKAADGVVFIATENSDHPDAVVIVDLSAPRGQRRLGAIPRTEVEGVHNLWIDGTTLYLASPGSDAFFSYDVSDPTAPTQIAVLPAGQQPHDIYVDDGIAYGSVLRPGELVVATAPDLAGLGSATWPGAFSHSAWPSESGRFLYVADEVLNAPIRILDVSDPANPVEVGTYQPRLGSIPHNFQVRGRFAFLSHYVHGVEVLDLADPANPELVGFFDTRPGADDAGSLMNPFQGAWGVHWTDDGRFVVSDMQRGLFVLRYTGPGGP